MKLSARLKQLEGIQQTGEPRAGLPSTRAHEALLEAIVRGLNLEASGAARQLVKKARRAPHVPANVARYILTAPDATDRGRALARHYLEAHHEA